LAEAQAVASPSAESVASLTDQIADLAAQKQILVTELASL
jgi:hypothetical protein